MNLMSVFFSKKIQIPLLFFLIALFIYSLFGRIPDIDDAWIGVDAFTLAKDGYVHNDLMHGINKQEELFVVHHKLLNLQGALAIKSFGFSLYTLKSLSLVYLLIFIGLFYFYTIRWKKLFKMNEFLFSMIIIISFPSIVKYSFIYRPEIMMMTFGFIGFILLEKYIEFSKKQSWLLLISGIFFGLTMVTHLNGLILSISAFFFLIWNRKYWSVIPYGLGVLIAFSIYFYDYTDSSYFDLWSLQFFNAPYLDSLNSVPAWFKPILNLLNEHMRYFHDLQIIVFSGFLIVTIIVGFRYLFENHTQLLQFAILVAIITGLVAMHKSRQYFLLNFPYFLMLIVLSIKALREGKISTFRIGNRKQITHLIVVLFVLFITVSFYYNYELAIQKFSPRTNHKITLKYAGDNAPKMKIVAPMTFIFNEIEIYDQIQGELCYTELQKLDTTIYGEGFLKQAYEFDRDLIMVSPLYQSKLGLENFEKGDDFEHYFVLDKTKNFMVFKVKSKNPF